MASKVENGDSGKEPKLHQVAKPWENTGSVRRAVLWPTNEQCMMIHAAL